MARILCGLDAALSFPFVPWAEQKERLEAGSLKGGESSVAESFARLKSAMDSTSDRVLTVGRDWVVSYANSSALASFKGLKVGQHYGVLFSSLLGAGAEQHHRDAMERRTEVHYEVFCAPQEAWYRVRVYPVEEGITLFLTDVTRERTEQERVAQEHLAREKRMEALSYMAGGVAHEISNPLAIIHEWAHDLKGMAAAKAVLSSGEVDAVCDKILKTTSRATNILRGLRAFAREASHDPKELASLYTIMDQALELQESRFKRQGVEIRTAFAVDLPLVCCREVQIGQILTNLLNNAFDAIVQSEARERWVEVMAKRVGLEMHVEVTDSGPGIEDHLKAHLMEPFFTTKEMGLGMGVGLSLSRALAQDHGGTLTLLNGAEHTCFRLSLPLDEAVPGGELTDREASHEVEPG